MEGWSTLNEGSDLHEVEIVETFKSRNKFSFDLDLSVKHGNVDGCSERLKNLFEQVLFVFLREVSRENWVRPIPAFLGNGQPADLFKLFWVVWKRGGYDLVSRNNLWRFVTSECSLDWGMMASVKLVYLKYLNELDQWLRRVFKDERLGIGDSKIGGKLGFLLLELQEEFKDLLCYGQDVKKRDGYDIESERKQNGKYDFGVDKRELLLSDARDINEVHVNAEKSLKTIDYDDKKFCVNEENNVVVSDTPVAMQVCTSQKRKRESLSLSGMLNWVTEAAKNSDDPAIGRVPECSKWKDYSSEEMWIQALLAREVLLTRPHGNSNTEEFLLQKKMKMHPSMYDGINVLNPRSAEGLRCSERLPSLTKPRFCPCCNSCSPCPTKMITPRKVGVVNSPKKKAHPSVKITGTNAIDAMPNDEPFYKQLSVGPLFQAEVSEWTGVDAENDSKWLGTTMWPPQNGKPNSFVEMDAIGKGRGDSCTCQLPGSVTCIRFHIAEKRMKLKLELGLLFYRWRFDRTGEEVSLSWTIAEEKRFKDMVRLKPPSLNKFFWDIQVLKFFPNKTREKLVSYYFNVFLVQQRRYQNRVSPKDIDSDDDETEFGCVGDSFGFEALNVPGPKLPMCTKNKQCMDL